MPEHTPDSRKKLLNLQALRGCACLLVLFSHITLYEGRVAEVVVLPNWLFKMGSAGVDLFFVISGYIMLSLGDGGSSGLKVSLNFILRRMARIYPLYWVFTAIVITILIFFPESIYRSGDQAAFNYFKSFFLIPDTNPSPPVGQGWSLVHEMYFYLTFTIILLFPSKTRKYLWILWLLFLATYVVGSISTKDPFIRIASSPLTFEFIFGCFAAYLHKSGFSRFGSIAFVLGVLGLLFFGHQYGPWRFLLVGVPAFLIVYGAIAMELGKGVVFPPWLQRTGDASYSIYLSHILVLGAVAKLWKRLPEFGILSNILLIAVMLAATTAFGFAVMNYVELPLTNTARSLVSRISRRFLS
jgi:exopolysaccharide production protein ExoZ